MKRRLPLVGGTSLIALALLVTNPHAQSQLINRAVAQPAITSSVKGSGTVGRLPRWTGATNPTDVVGDSIITETGTGRIGIGVATPGSKLSVAGTIESTLGGFKFPDGTLQTTGALSAITHDATLAGTGGVGSPLGVAAGGLGTTHLVDNAVTAQKIAPASVVKGLNGLTDNVTLAAGSGVTLTSSGNTVTIAAEAANPAQHAFQTTGVINLLDDVTQGEMTIAVPAGRRFVIEYVNVDVLISGASTLMDARFITNINGVAAIYHIPFTFTENDAISSLPVKIYADGSITLRLSRAAGGQTMVRFVFSGHLVDL